MRVRTVCYSIGLTNTIRSTTQSDMIISCLLLLLSCYVLCLYHNNTGIRCLIPNYAVCIKWLRHVENTSLSWKLLSPYMIRFQAIIVYNDEWSISGLADNWVRCLFENPRPDLKKTQAVGTSTGEYRQPMQQQGLTGRTDTVSTRTQSLVWVWAFLFRFFFVCQSLRIIPFYMHSSSYACLCNSLLQRPEPPGCICKWN